MGIARYLATLVGLCITAAPVLATENAPPPELQGLAAYIQKSMLDWKTPGLAIAVIKDDQVVWEAGFGVRTLGKPEPVDADTLFGIGSNTKAFTAAALGTLVDAGKLGWDGRVIDYLKDFQLYDPYATREVTLRDLLSHRSGVCGEDGVWYGTDFTSQEILHHLRFQKPQYSFRAGFCYSNSLYMTAGQIIPAVAGQSWNDYIRERLFKPLHMRDSTTSISAFTPETDVATPHAEVDGKLAAIDWDNTDNIDPAGAINSSVHEMSQWLRMLLAGGRYEGQQVLPAGVIAEMETPQIVISGSDPEGKFLSSLNPDSHFYAYGFGFFLQDYAGTKVVWHSGHIDGMSAGLGMVPSEHLGVVVLSNMDQSWLPMALVWRVVDAYTHQPVQDWSAGVLARVKPQYDQDLKSQQQLAQAYIPGTAPLPAVTYVGSYENPLYGKVEVALEDGKLVLHVSRRFVGDLQHWNHDTFQVQWRYHYFDKSYATFALDAFGQPATLTLPGFTTYTKVVDKDATAK